MLRLLATFQPLAVLCSGHTAGGRTEEPAGSHTGCKARPPHLLPAVGRQPSSPLSSAASPSAMAGQGGPAGDQPSCLLPSSSGTTHLCLSTVACSCGGSWAGSDDHRSPSQCALGHPPAAEPHRHMPHMLPPRVLRSSQGRAGGLLGRGLPVRRPERRPPYALAAYAPSKPPGPTGLRQLPATVSSFNPKARPGEPSLCPTAVGWKVEPLWSWPRHQPTIPELTTCLSVSSPAPSVCFPLEAFPSLRPPCPSAWNAPLALRLALQEGVPMPLHQHPGTTSLLAWTWSSSGDTCRPHQSLRSLRGGVLAARRSTASSWSSAWNTVGA